MALAIPSQQERQVTIASGLDVLAGLWLLLSAFVLNAPNSLAWSNAVAGAAVAILAAIRALGAYTQSWISWVNCILGVYVVFSPWLVSDARIDAAAWNTVITGVLIVVLAAWSALATHNNGPRHTGRPTPPL